jgi:GMP synthase-like glutamine amidotransferase
MKIYIVSGNYQYDELFRSMGHSLVATVQAADMVCFTGGADVTPDLYGDKAHPYTGYDRRRDEDEEVIYHAARMKGIPMVGICRGGQFLNVMNGGRMYQHVSKHTAPHEITDLETGETVLVSSTHHQMMMMASEGILVASSTNGGSREWFDLDVARKDVSKEDIEVVFYPNTKSLCFQPHPEFPGYEYVGMHKYFASLMTRFFGDKS